MVESRSRILVGHDGDITYVGVEVDAEGGSLWSRILPLVRGRHLVLDFCGVSGDAAFLLQEVLMLASVLQRRETRLWLSRIPIALIRRLGARRGAISGTSCLSLEAPFFCAVCETEFPVDLDVTPDLMRQGTNGIDTLQQYKCPACFSTMQFNEMPEAFFSFMDRMEAPIGLGSLRSRADNARCTAKEHLISDKNELTSEASSDISSASPVDALRGVAVSSDRQMLYLETAVAVALSVVAILLAWRLF